MFGPLSVRDNLRLGSYRRGRGAAGAIDEVFALFPVLSKRSRQAAGSLSGGQQQMLAIGRALMSSPRLLLLDEPSMGLAPIVTGEIFAALAERHRRDALTILLVEQNVNAALKLADRGYVLTTGKVSATGRSAALMADEAIQRAYLGA